MPRPKHTDMNEKIDSINEKKIKNKRKISHLTSPKSSLARSCDKTSRCRSKSAEVGRPLKVPLYTEKIGHFFKLRLISELYSTKNLLYQ